MVGVEAPCYAQSVKAALELGQHATMAHAFHALPLVSFWHVATNEGKRHRVEAIGEHFVDVVDQFPRYAVLVRSEAFAKSAHGPIHPIPVEGGETGPDAESGLAEISAGARKNGAIGIGFLKQVLDPDQVLVTGRKVDLPIE